MADAIVLHTPHFEEVVMLKPTDRNRFLGFGTDGSKLAAVTVKSGILRVEAFEQSVALWT